MEVLRIHRGIDYIIYDRSLLQTGQLPPLVEVSTKSNPDLLPTVHVDYSTSRGGTSGSRNCALRVSTKKGVICTLVSTTDSEYASPGYTLTTACVPRICSTREGRHGSYVKVWPLEVA